MSKAKRYRFGKEYTKKNVNIFIVLKGKHYSIEGRTRKEAFKLFDKVLFGDNND